MEAVWNAGPAGPSCFAGIVVVAGSGLGVVAGWDETSCGPSLSPLPRMLPVCVVRMSERASLEAGGVDLFTASPRVHASAALLCSSRFRRIVSRNCGPHKRSRLHDPPTGQFQSVTCLF